MRKNSLARQVRRAYDQRDLARVCTLREDRFGRAFGMQTVKVEPRWASYSDQSEDYYHFRDNNSSVLAVAHLDTVVRQAGRVPHFRSTERGPLIVSGALDDRLGAYVITHLLPRMGINCDWLLTVGEESGASTAEFFDAHGKKYDWAIEFDRTGTDVVMYQYDDEPTRQLVRASGAAVGNGSFSDVAYLEHLGVKAFNWGVGYRGNYHSENGYAYLNDTFSMVARYMRFHEQNAGTRLPHDPDAGRSRSRDGYYSKWDDDYYGDCDVCCTKESVDSVTGYCLYCHACADCGLIENEGCMCFVPSHVRDEAADGEVISITPVRDWREMTWGEYHAARPGKWDYDDVLCIKCSRHVARCECADWDDNPGAQPVKIPAGAGCGDCGEYLEDCTCGTENADAYELDELRAATQRADDADAYEAALEDARTADGDGPAVPRSPSIAPPWSEHRPDVSYGLGVPTSRKRQSRKARKAGKSGESRGAGLSEDLMTAVAAYAKRERKARAVTEDQGWHEAAKGVDDYVIAHRPDQAWAGLCLRCTSRWPHPVRGSRDIHGEADCPGCQRCIAADAVRITTGAIHVIPAHLAGESDICGKCQAWSAALTAIDRGSPAEPRQAMRALDEQDDQDNAEAIGQAKATAHLLDR